MVPVKLRDSTNIEIVNNNKQLINFLSDSGVTLTFWQALEILIGEGDGWGKEFLVMQEVRPFFE